MDGKHRAQAFPGLRPAGTLAGAPRRHAACSGSITMDEHDDDLELTPVGQATDATRVAEAVADGLREIAAAVERGLERVAAAIGPAPRRRRAGRAR